MLSGDSLELTYQIKFVSAQMLEISVEDFDIYQAELWKVTAEWFDALQEREHAKKKEKTARQQRLANALAGKGWKV